MFTFNVDQYGRYYLIFSRAWELLSGSGACLFSYYIYRNENLRGSLSKFVNINKALIVVNILIILSVMFSVKPSLNWPRIITIIPILATVMLIVQFHLYSIRNGGNIVGLYNTRGGNSRLLFLIINNGFLKYIGKSSYSIYLYHWPVFSALLYIDYRFGERAYDYLIYFVTLLLLSDLSYRILEKNRKLISRKKAICILLLFTSFCYGVSFQAFSNSAYPDSQQIVRTGKFSDSCSICVESPKKDFLILWGDSHAKALVSSIEKYCVEKGWDLVFVSTMPLVNENNSHEKIADLIKLPNYQGMVLTSRWSMYLGFQDDEPEESGTRYIHFNGGSPSNRDEAIIAFKEGYNALINKEIMKNSVILLQVPRYPFFPVKEALLEEKGLKFRRLSNKTLSQHRKEHRAVNEIFYSVNGSDIVIADPASILCPKGICKWRDGVDLFYKDDDHLSAYGADLIMPLIIKALDNYK